MDDDSYLDLIGSGCERSVPSTGHNCYVPCLPRCSAGEVTTLAGVAHKEGFTDGPAHSAMFFHPYVQPQMLVEVEVEAEVHIDVDVMLSLFPLILMLLAGIEADGYAVLRTSCLTIALCRVEVYRALVAGLAWTLTVLATCLLPIRATTASATSARLTAVW